MKTIVHFTLWIVLLSIYVFGVILPIAVMHHWRGWIILELAVALAYLFWVFIALFWNRQRMVDNFEAIGKRYGRTKLIASFWTSMSIAIAGTAIVIRFVGLTLNR